MAGTRVGKRVEATVGLLVADGRRLMAVAVLYNAASVWVASAAAVAAVSMAGFESVVEVARLARVAVDASMTTLTVAAAVAARLGDSGVSTG